MSRTNTWWQAPALLPLALAGLIRTASADGTAAGLAPDKREEQTLTQTLQVLERTHYDPPALDDEVSRSTLEDFLSALDPERTAFLASDVEELERTYGTTLDDALRRSDLTPAFAIFQRYLQRREEQLDYLAARAEKGSEGLSLDGDGTIERDRRQEPWPADRDAAKALWEAEYRNDVLTARLEGRSDTEIRDILRRRYAGLREQLGRVKSEDVFALFMNVVAGEFDPHTNYFPKLAADDFETAMSLTFQGIGAVLGTDGEYARIERLLPGGPAERSGHLHPTDRIVAVGQGKDGAMTDVVGWRLDEIVALIRGPKGSTVRLQILPADAEAGGGHLVELRREQVQLEEEAARSQVIEVGSGETAARIGVITLPAFYHDFEAVRAGNQDARSSARDVAKILGDLEAKHVDGIVLDLRNNGGGALEEAQALAGLFLGPVPVVQVRDARDHVQVLGGTARIAYTGPLVVLVNRLSASASEIVAAAIQDYGRGVIAGSRTFGKGTVQGVVPLEDGQVNVTEAKFYRVSGGSTQNRGVEPDLELPASYDPSLIGESTLPGALPYDGVRPVVRVGAGPVAEVLSLLSRRHAERERQDPNLVALTERLALRHELEARARLSLNETLRRQEQKDVDARLLAIENRRRQGLGEKQLASLPDDEAQEDGDAVLQEAAHVAADLAAAIAPMQVVAARPLGGVR